MKRLIVFLSGICLLIVSVSCSQPTGPKPSAEETALFRELYGVTDRVRKLEPGAALPDGITKETSDGKTVYTVAETYTPKVGGAAAGISGTFSFKDKVLNVDLKKGGKSLVIRDQPFEAGKKIIISIDGNEYEIAVKSKSS